MEKKHFFDKPENLKRLLRIFYAICAGLFLIDAVFHRHVIHAWESLFGFYAVFGFVACVLLVLAATEMRKVLMRKDNFYDDDDR
jgi:hypothetical protein